MNYSQEKKMLFYHNPHLKSYVRKRLLAFFLKLLFLELLVFALSLYLKEYTSNVWFIAAFLALVLPFLILKPLKNWGKVGLCEITKIVPSMRSVPRQKGFTRVYYLDYRNLPFIACHVKSSYGRKFKFDYEKHYEGAFDVGDRLLILPCCKYPINVTLHDWYVCPFCGNVMPRANERCIACHEKTVLIPSADK